MTGGTSAAPSALLLSTWLRTHKKQLAACAAAVVAGYLGYKAYHSKSASQLSKVKQTVQDYLSTLSAISGSVNVVASDLHAYLNSDSDELPRSLRQLNKLLQSPDVQATISNTATSLATSLSAAVSNATSSSTNSSFSSEPVLQTILDAVLSDRGRSLVGMAVGLATKNATATFCEFLERTMQRQQGPMSAADTQQAAAAGGPSSSPHLNTALALLASEQGERVLSLLITKSIKTAVSTYIDCTTGYNVYEDMVASISKQEHRDAVSDVMSRITAAFCRELAAAYRRATRASSQQQQQHHQHLHHVQQQQQQQTGAPSSSSAHTAIPGRLSCSSASSSSNSVISLTGHLQTSTTETNGLQSCKVQAAVSGRYSIEEPGTAAAAAVGGDLQPRLSGAGSVAPLSGLGPPPLASSAPLTARYSNGGNNGNCCKANAPRAALNAAALVAASLQQQAVAAGTAAAAVDVMGGSSSSAWWRPLVDLAREQHVRSLTLDVVKSATREATRSTWESLFSSASSTSSTSLVSWLFGGDASGSSSVQQHQQWAMYRMYAVCTVLISIFMYAVSPRVIAV